MANEEMNVRQRQPKSCPKEHAIRWRGGVRIGRQTNKQMADPDLVLLGDKLRSDSR
jgi:hypothetical protein